MMQFQVTDLFAYKPKKEGEREPIAQKRVREALLNAALTVHEELRSQVSEDVIAVNVFMLHRLYEWSLSTQNEK